MKKEHDSLLRPEDLLKRLHTRAQKEPSFSFGRSEHFVVMYTRGIHPLHFHPSWIDSHPISLAQYLEAELLQVAEHFELTIPATVHFISVRQPLWLVPLDGINYGAEMSSFPFGKGEKLQDASWSTIFSRSEGSKKYTPPVPPFYSSAVHEAIGHGFMLDTLLRQWKDKRENAIPFLNEGIAYYIENLHFPERMHDNIIFYIAFRALKAFPNLRDGFTFDGLSTNFISSQMDIARGFSGLKTGAFFNLRESRAGKRWFQRRFGEAFEEHYFRGRSFIASFIRHYGADKFCLWASLVADTGILIGTLESVIGASIEEVESQWKKDVLEAFDVVTLYEMQVRKFNLPGQEVKLCRALIQTKFFLEHLDLDGRSIIL
ncbi:MAG: hypothetical protein Q8R11_03240 [bacterium]|nr:hypothetical protein [bacterium]